MVPEPEERRIVEMKITTDDAGEIHTEKVTRHSGRLPEWILKIAGIAVGVGIFLLLITFFIYVALPLILLFLLWLLLKNIYNSLAR